MKKITKVLFIFFIIALFSTSISMATDVNNTNNSTSNEIINHDLFMSSTSVTLENRVEGNAFIYGSEVTIKGEIRGNLFVATNTLLIDKSANITGSLFVYGNQVTISGVVNTVYGSASTININETGRINNDLYANVENLNLQGYIGRNVKINVSNITLKETDQHIVGGDFTYTALQDLSIPRTAVVGEISFTKSNSVSTSLVTSYIISFILVLLYSIVFILIVAGFMKNTPTKLTYAMEKRPFVSATIGILGIVIVPILAIVLMLTGFFLYVGIALLAIYFLVLSTTIAILSMAIGNYICNKFKNKTKGKFILFSILSVIVIWLLQRIPFVGSWISIFTVIFGFGLFIFSFFNRKDVSELVEVEETNKNSTDHKVTKDSKDK